MRCVFDRTYNQFRSSYLGFAVAAAFPLISISDVGADQRALGTRHSQGTLVELPLVFVFRA
jgi:hypothetical protein